VRSRARLVVMLSGGISVLLAACGSMSALDSGSPTPQRSPTTAAVSPMPSAAVPVPSPTEATSRVVGVTVADLEEQLTRQSHGLGGFLGAPKPGGGEPAAVITCQGNGPLRGGDAITCRWEPVLPADVEVWGCENPPVERCGGGQ
jgi:hypothetical protein